jgi:hypothetical protein
VTQDPRSYAVIAASHFEYKTACAILRQSTAAVRFIQNKASSYDVLVELPATVIVVTYGLWNRNNDVPEIGAAFKVLQERGQIVDHLPG